MGRAPTLNNKGNPSTSSTGEVDDFYTHGNTDGSIEVDLTGTVDMTIKVFGHNNNPDDRSTGEGEALGTVDVTSSGHHTASWSGKAYEYITIEVTDATSGTFEDYWLWLTGLGAVPMSGGGRESS